MGADAGWHTKASLMQHRGPEEGVEVQNIFADEVHEFGLGTGFPGGIKIEPLLVR